MQKIDSFFDRIRNLLFKEQEKNILILKAIKDVTGLDLDTEAIKIEQNQIFIKASAIVRNELSLRQEALQEAINNAFPTTGHSYKIRLR